MDGIPRVILQRPPQKVVKKGSSRGRLLITDAVAWQRQRRRRHLNSLFRKQDWKCFLDLRPKFKMTKISKLSTKHKQSQQWLQCWVTIIKLSKQYQQRYLAAKTSTKSYVTPKKPLIGPRFANRGQKLSIEAVSSRWGDHDDFSSLEVSTGQISMVRLRLLKASGNFCQLLLFRTCDRKR